MVESQPMAVMHGVSLQATESVATHCPEPLQEAVAHRSFNWQLAPLGAGPYAHAPVLGLQVPVD